MRLLLVSGGHANVALLRAAGRWTRAGVEVTLLGDAPHLLYSGMTPEYLGGLYTLPEARIDLGAWCRRNGVRFARSPAVGLDPERRVVIYRKRHRAAVRRGGL